jgi:hypothetical protein
MTARGLLRFAVSFSALTWAVMLPSAPVVLGRVVASPNAGRHSLRRLGPSHRPHKRPTAFAHASIVGGKIAESGTFPWLAFVIDFRGDEVGGCTGTVVAANLILTAAHCAEDPETGEIREPSGYRVFTDNVDWASSEGEVSGVLRVIAYPHGTSVSVESWPDAALLELSSPIQAPAVKLASSEIWGSGTGAIIAGWGETYYGQGGPTELLRWASTVVQSKQWCEANAPGFDPLGQICTIDAPSYVSGTCLGDSGGPLLALQPGTKEFIEIGITSSGPQECSTMKPDLFTRSDLVASWVNAQIRELTPPAPEREMAPPPSEPAPGETLPTMTHARTAAFVRQDLTEAFGATFTHRFGYRTSCRRIGAVKQKCGVSWSHGPNDYYGWITVYNVLENGEVLWNDRYTIHWVNDHCYFYSHRKGPCKVHTRHG